MASRRIQFDCRFATLSFSFVSSSCEDFDDMIVDITMHQTIAANLNFRNLQKPVAATPRVVRLDGNPNSGGISPVKYGLPPIRNSWRETNHPS
ncbi:hypothetical protein L2E82_52429 [Cichorium intybus]|nr:hypothetical protein L2E82_52429 [Cichorium intybus]